MWTNKKQPKRTKFHLHVPIMCVNIIMIKTLPLKWKIPIIPQPCPNRGTNSLTWIWMAIYILLCFAHVIMIEYAYWNHCVVNNETSNHQTFVICYWLLRALRGLNLYQCNKSVLYLFKRHTTPFPSIHWIIIQDICHHQDSIRGVATRKQ